jgi:hypothetical protein
MWLTEESDGRRASTFAFHSSQLVDWQEHLTPYNCHELDGKRKDPYWAMVHTEVIHPHEPRFVGGNLIRATRDVVVQISYLVNLQSNLLMKATGKFYSWMRDEEAAFVCRADGREESLGWHVPLEFPVFPEEERVRWWWARYRGYGVLFIPVWDEMEGVREGWRLSIDRSNVHLGKYTSQGLGNYGLLVDYGDRDDAGVLRLGDGWRTCIVLRPTSDDLEEVRGLAAFYCGRVKIEGDRVKLGPRTLFVPGREIAELGKGDRPWDVVVEGVQLGKSFELTGVSGCGVLTVTLRGEIGGNGIRYACDGASEWQELSCDQPAPDTAVFSLSWKNNRSVRIQVL